MTVCIKDWGWMRRKCNVPTDSSPAPLRGPAYQGPACSCGLPAAHAIQYTKGTSERAESVRVESEEDGILREWRLGFRASIAAQ